MCLVESLRAWARNAPYGEIYKQSEGNNSNIILQDYPLLFIHSDMSDVQ